MATEQERILLDIEINADQAAKQQAELTLAIERDTKARRDLKKQIQDNERAIELLSKAKRKNVKEVARLEKTNKDLAKQMGTVNRRLTENRKENRLLDREINAQVGSINELRARLSRLTKEYNGVQVGSDRFNELQQQIKKTNTELKKHESAIGDNRRNVGNYGSALDAVKGSLIGAFGAGAILAGAQKLVSEVVQIIGAFQDLRGEVRGLTGETGDGLDEIVEKTQATAKVFEKDFSDVLISANAVSKQLGVTTVEALDLINQGFLAGADANGEFLDNLREYPAQFREAGLSAEQSIALITAQVKEGVFSDKGVDAIKEATLRLRELTPATRDALDLIGISSDAVQQSLEDGSKTTFDIIQEVSGALKGLPETSVEVGTAIADIFGGPGEDAGLQYLETLGDIELELEDLIDDTDTLTRVQQGLLEQEERLAGAQNDLSKSFAEGGNVFQEAWNEIKIDFFATVNELTEKFQFLRDVFSEGISVAAQNVIEQEFAENTIPLIEKFNEKLTRTQQVHNAKLLALDNKRINNLIKNREFANIDEELELRTRFAINKTAFDAILALGKEEVEEVEEVEKTKTGITKSESDKRQKILEEEAEAARKLAFDQTQQAIKEEQEAIARAFKAQDELDKLRDQQIKDTEDRELAQLETRFTNRLNAIVGFSVAENELRLALEEQFQEDSRNIRVKFANQEIEDAQKRAQIIIESEENLSNARNQFFADTIAGLRGLAGEQNSLAQALFVLEKFFAIGQVQVALQRELAEIRAGAALVPPLLPPGIPNPAFIASRVFAAGQAVKARVRAGFATGKILATTIQGLTAEEGLAISMGRGGAKEGVFGGKPHSSGGTDGIFSDGTSINVERDEIFTILNKRSSNALRAMSDLNQAGGGRSYFSRRGGAFAKAQDGGIASQLLAAPIRSDVQFRNDLVRIVSSLPPPEVGVRAIRFASSKAIKVRVRAII